MRILLMILSTALLTLSVLPGSPRADEERLLGGPPDGSYRSHPVNPFGARDLCRQLAFHGEAGDYVAGADAAGHPVPPADVDDHRVTHWSPVVTFDLSEPRGRLPFRFRGATVGTVEVDTGTGRVSIDGVALDDRELADLQRFCATR